MQTRIFDLQTEYEQGLSAAAQEIERGGLVVFPTETVYGIGADAENPEAVRRIFCCQGPADGQSAHRPCLRYGCGKGRGGGFASGGKSSSRFWPGPFTAVLKSKGLLPQEVSAGLATVALRMPSDPVARELIARSGKYIAAPSANLSGRPSGTTAADVAADFDGLVPIILDGGAAEVGVESTVCDLTGETPVILRPGGVTAEMLQTLCGAWKSPRQCCMA